jgi:hypothetical protein
MPTAPTTQQITVTTLKAMTKSVVLLLCSASNKRAGPNKNPIGMGASANKRNFIFPPPVGGGFLIGVNSSLINSLSHFILQSAYDGIKTHGAILPPELKAIAQPTKTIAAIRITFAAKITIATNNETSSDTKMDLPRER